MIMAIVVIRVSIYIYTVKALMLIRLSTMRITTASIRTHMYMDRNLLSYLSLGNFAAKKGASIKLILAKIRQETLFAEPTTQSSKNSRETNFLPPARSLLYETVFEFVWILLFCHVLENDVVRMRVCA